MDVSRAAATPVAYGPTATQLVVTGVTASDLATAAAANNGHIDTTATSGIGAALASSFAAAHITLASTVTLTVVTAGSVWELVSAGSTYEIKKDGSEFDVYAPGTVRVSIAGIDQWQVDEGAGGPSYLVALVNGSLVVALRAHPTGSQVALTANATLTSAALTSASNDSRTLTDYGLGREIVDQLTAQGVTLDGSTQATPVVYGLTGTQLTLPGLTASDIALFATATGLVDAATPDTANDGYITTNDSTNNPKGVLLAAEFQLAGITLAPHVAVTQIDASHWNLQTANGVVYEIVNDGGTLEGLPAGRHQGHRARQRRHAVAAQPGPRLLLPAHAVGRSVPGRRADDRLRRGRRRAVGELRRRGPASRSRGAGAAAINSIGFSIHAYVSGATLTLGTGAHAGQGQLDVEASSNAAMLATIVAVAVGVGVGGGVGVGAALGVGVATNDLGDVTKLDGSAIPLADAVVRGSVRLQ